MTADTSLKKAAAEQIGQAESVNDNGTNTTVEENTSITRPDDGDEVCRMVRHPAEVRGFGRPVYNLIQAKALYIYERKTHRILFEKNIHKRLFIGSLTKLSVLLELLRSGVSLDTVIRIPERLLPEFRKIDENDGFVTELLPGTDISLRLLFLLTLSASMCNTASIIADYLSNGCIESFVDQMNRTAYALGCRDTYYSCVHGLYEDTEPLPGSSASDILLIAEECMKYEVFRQAASLPGFDGEYNHSRKHYNSTICIQKPGDENYRPYIKGIKTGSTDLAGLCICLHAEYGDREIMAAILGTPNSFSDPGPRIRTYHNICRLFDELLDYKT